MRRRLTGLLRFLSSGPWTPLRLTGVTFGCLFAIFIVGGGYRFYTYVEDDPTFCRSCHTMEKAWDRWQTSEHSKVTCHACHESDPAESAQQIIKFVLNRPEDVSKHAVVQNDACARCHESGNPQWHQIANTAGHRVHVDGQHSDCVTCHSTSVHRFKPPEEICAKCHDSKNITITEMAEQACTSCHNYLAAGGKLEPTRETCVTCHEKRGVAVAQSDGPVKVSMHFECSNCHEPHKNVAPQTQCASCHQDTIKAALHARPTHASTSCTTCHQPHEWAVSGRESCTTCHQNKVEHNKGADCTACHSFSQTKKST